MRRRSSAASVIARDLACAPASASRQIKSPPRTNRLRACSLPHVGMRADREGIVIGLCTLHCKTDTGRFRKAVSRQAATPSPDLERAKTAGAGTRIPRCARTASRRDLARLAAALHEALRLQRAVLAGEMQAADRFAHRAAQRGPVARAAGRRSCPATTDAWASGSALRSAACARRRRRGTRARAPASRRRPAARRALPERDAVRAAGEVGQHAGRAGLLARGLPRGLVRQVGHRRAVGAVRRARRGGRSRSSASRWCRRRACRSRGASPPAAARRSRTSRSSVNGNARITCGARTSLRRAAAAEGAARSHRRRARTASSTLRRSRSRRRACRASAARNQVVAAAHVEALVALAEDPERVRVVGADEHCALETQGFMEGGVESGQIAADAVLQVAESLPARPFSRSGGAGRGLRLSFPEPASIILQCSVQSR